MWFVKKADGVLYGTVAGGGWRNHQIFYAKNAVRVPPDGERALRAQPVSLLYGSFFSTGVRGSQLVSFYSMTYVSQKNRRRNILRTV